MKFYSSEKIQFDMKRNLYAHISKTALLALLLVFFASHVAAQFTVSGTLETPIGQKMDGFAIIVTGTENKIVYTTSGDYSFTLQAGGAYNIRPVDCTANPLNGVTTYDLLLMTRHIEGTELFDSPYRIIAADVDNSNSLETVDTNIVRNLILGVVNEFPVSHFRFVLKDYVFPNPLDPFTPAFPESYSIANLDGDITEVDFIGVKKGDVNGTAIQVFECNALDLPAKIVGRVFNDANNDCQYTATESGMDGWMVSATDGVSSYFARSSADGTYELQTLPGTYDVTLANPAGLWGGCPEVVTGVTTTIQDLGEANFGLQAQVFCPSLQVDLATSALRRCFNNQTIVSYCNTGTTLAENAYIEVQFDTFFNVYSSTLPWSAVNGNTYTFQLGDVPAGDCGYFRVNFVLNCDAVLGQTHCSEAHIFPDTFCATPGLWNGAELRVHGYCAGNEVKFLIVNQGADMLVPSNYIVVEDIVVMAPPVNNPFTLQGGNTEVISVPANGATWRLEAEQPVGYPWGQVASAAVEGCGTNANGDFSRGFITKFSPDDQSPTIDINCLENVGSFDPNDKQGFPTGVLAEHYIPLNQPIEYLIRFQNTGTDTAFTVMIRDTLDVGFEVASVRPLGSSHPYSFSVMGQNILQFTFASILLPDSNTNEVASHGFVKFNIEPKKDLLNGTVVQNKAAIYFDFNDPVITNTTWHTFGDKYLDVSNVVFSLGIGLDVFPNPSTEYTTFLLKSASPVRGTLQVFDMSGSRVSEQDFEHNQFEFQSGQLQAGCYFFKIISNDQPLAAGKMIVLKK